MSMSDLNLFLGGAICMGDIAATLLFLAIWRRTQDRLFAWFAAAFVMLALERALLFWHAAQGHPTVYLTRLAAFLLIIAAIIDRNRRPSA